MKAITIKQPGGAEQLRVQEFENPTPKRGELLVKVSAAAVNRTDILSRQKGHGYGSNPILGVEVAGTVEKIGPGVSTPVGTRVMGLVNGGGYAQYAVLPASRAMEIPDNLSFEQAAAIPEVFLTAYQTLFWIGQLTLQETVLIHAGGSGVGTAAIQLAKQLTKSTVITTAGSQKKLDFCTSLGADVPINYKEQAFHEEVLKSTQNLGVDLILDFVGGSYWNKNLASIKVDGRWVLIGILGGAEVEKMNLLQLMSKRIQLTGTMLTPRSDAYKAALTKEFASKTMDLFGDNTLKPIVDSVFDLEQVQAAHQRMENNENIGKIILRI